jgi:tetratricopeptide (TPR) repeat protein
MRKVLAALGVVLGCVAPGPAFAQDSNTRILVMPFDNPGREPRLHWIAEAATLLIADELNARGVAAIRRAERAQAFEELHLPAAANLSRATVIKVGQLVAASEVIVGAVKLDGDSLVLEAHSIRIDVGRLQPHVTERGPLTDVVVLFERLAARLAPGTSIKGTRTPRPPLEAFEAYVKGLMAESAASRASFLEAAIDAHPGYDRAHLALWDVRRDQADHAAALASARAVAANSPFSRRAKFLASISLLELKRFDEAFDGFAALTEAAPPLPAAAAFNNLGIVQLRRGPSERGVPTYFLTRAADLDPGDPGILFNLGYAYVLEKNFQGAIYWLREALRRDPADAESHYLLSVALRGTGGDVEATRERELAVQLSSQVAELERRAVEEKIPAARGLERLREDPESRIGLRPEQSIASSAQREQRDLAAFHLDNGRRLFEKEENSAALAELRRVVYLSPYEAEAHLLIGRIHLRGGRTAEAVEALKISIWSTDTLAARIALAETYIKQDNTAGARTELERALSLDPNSAEAKRLLASLAGK